MDNSRSRYNSEIGI